MTRSPGFAALIDDGAFLAHEAQLQLADEIDPSSSWNVDLQAGTISFTAPGAAPLTHGVQLLGSAAPGPRSWLWGWANPSGYSDQVLQAAHAARALGEQYAISELTTPELPFDADEDSQVEPGYRLGADLSIAVRVAARSSWFAYSGSLDGGTRVWMLVDGPVLAPASTPRTVRVIGEVLQAGQLTDHRRAVGSYAALRALPWDGATLTLPDGALSISFDGHGRISGLNGQAGPQA